MKSSLDISLIALKNASLTISGASWLQFFKSSNDCSFSFRKALKSFFKAIPLSFKTTSVDAFQFSTKPNCVRYCEYCAHEDGEESIPFLIASIFAILLLSSCGGSNKYPNIHKIARSFLYKELALISNPLIFLTDSHIRSNFSSLVLAMLLDELIIFSASEESLNVFPVPGGP